MSLASGTRLGPYEILAPIGAGGMGEVYRARDSRLGREVAIKVLPAAFAADPDRLHRFEQEARAIAALNHPHICQIYDVGPDYLVLEYIEGQPLQGPLRAEEAVRLAIQIAGALEAAHARGILHRDLKPANIMVTGGGAAKLLDFGLAKLMDTDADVDDRRRARCSARWPTCRRSRRKASRSMRGPMSSASARCCTRCSRARARSTATTTAQVLSAVLRDEPPPLQASAALERDRDAVPARSSAGRSLSDDGRGEGGARTGAREVSAATREHHAPSPCCRSPT